jgi:D-alanyl-D-alanine carboxypeptidase/D-alanyl-D-alanine-endopeptidase (penicillin-binding protein 4)
MTRLKLQTTNQIMLLGRLLFCAFVLLQLNVAVFGQASPSPTPTPSPAPQLQILQAPTPTPTPEERPLYGLQGVLVETLSGKVVSSQFADQQFNPASAVKLATSLIALKTFGPDHRFATGVWTDGALEKSTGTINGNLYISGRDPSFHYEHAVLLARELNQLGITKVTGDLVIAPSFTMNFNSSARHSGDQLYDTLDSTLRRPKQYAPGTMSEHCRTITPVCKLFRVSQSWVL